MDSCKHVKREKMMMIFGEQEQLEVGGLFRDKKVQLHVRIIGRLGTHNGGDNGL